MNQLFCLTKQFLYGLQIWTHMKVGSASCPLPQPLPILRSTPFPPLEETFSFNKEYPINEMLSFRAPDANFKALVQLSDNLKLCLTSIQEIFIWVGCNSSNWWLPFFFQFLFVFVDNGYHFRNSGRQSSDKNMFTCLYDEFGMPLWSKSTMEKFNIIMQPQILGAPPKFFRFTVVDYCLWIDVTPDLVE